MDKLEEKIQNIAQSVRFSSEEKQALRKTVLQHMEDATVSSNYSEIHARRGVEIFEAFSFLRLKYAPVALVLGLLFVGGGVTYAAEGALPGDTLYPVKLLSEDVRGAVAIAAEDQIEWNVRRAERRLEEAEALAAEDRLNDEAHAIVARQFEEHADRVIARLSSADVSNTSAAADLGVRFEASLEAHEAILRSFEERAAAGTAAGGVRKLTERVRNTATTLAFLAPVEASGRSIAALRSPSSTTRVPDGIDGDAAASGEGIGIATFSTEGSVDAVATATTSGSGLSAPIIPESSAARIGATASAGLNETTRLFEARRDALSSRSIDATEGALAEARAALELGDDLVETGEFSEAFHAYRTSLKISRRLAVFLEADVRLNVKDLLEGVLPASPIIHTPEDSVDVPTDRPVSDSSGEQDSAPPARDGGGFGHLNTNVVVEHTFESGTHRYRGTVVLPNPCYSLDSRVAVAESFPEQIHIDLSAQSSGGVCAQVIAEKEFDIIVDASDDATVSINLNGAPLDISLSSQTEGDTGIILPVEPDGGNGSGAIVPGSSAGSVVHDMSDTAEDVSGSVTSGNASTDVGAQGSTGSVGASVSGAVKKAAELFR